MAPVKGALQKKSSHISGELISVQRTIDPQQRRLAPHLNSPGAFQLPRIEDSNQNFPSIPRSGSISKRTKKELERLWATAPRAGLSTKFPDFVGGTGYEARWKGHQYKEIEIKDAFSDGVDNGKDYKDERTQPPRGWLVELAMRYLPTVMDVRGLQPHYMFGKLPDGYYVRQLQDETGLGYKHWLYGHPTPEPFMSIEEFEPHFLYMVENRHTDACDCVLCRKVRSKGRWWNFGEGRWEEYTVQDRVATEERSGHRP